MKRVLELLWYKLKALTSKKLAFSATVIGSRIHPQASVRQNVRFYNSQIGRYSYIARNTLVQNTQIGAFCSISEGCNIGLPAHPVDYVSSSPVFLRDNNYLHAHFAQFPFEDCPATTIGNDVWIGAHVQIKSGVTIGDGAVIGAGAVVTHDIPPYAIAVGVPAKLVRCRFSEDTVANLEKLAWWEWSEEKLKTMAQYFDDPAKLFEDQQVRE